MFYDDANRGVIINRERAKQIIDFHGLKYGRITPTDIDGCIEYRNKGVAYIEIKYRDQELPKGQELALTRMTDNHRSAGKIAVLFVCEHFVDKCEMDVDASKTIVRAYYYNGKWWSGNNVLDEHGNRVTLKEKMDKFIKYVDSVDEARARGK